MGKRVDRKLVPSGKMRAFEVSFTVTARLRVDNAVLLQGLADDGFIMTRPDLMQVLEHLGFNLIIGHGGIELSRIDGYANCDDRMADVAGRQVDLDSVVEMTGGKNERLL